MIITPAIKHDHEICVMPVFPANVHHALLYLVAGVTTNSLRALKNTLFVIASEAKQSHKLFIIKEIATAHMRLAMTGIKFFLVKSMILLSRQSRNVISTAGRNLRFLSRYDSFEMTGYR